MNAPRSLWLRTLLACVLVVAIAAGARAQSCGDPDGNGIDVVDAANVLRAAVALPSSCGAAPALCDVDGSGTITVIDAANVLRAAVSLPAASACSIANQQVADVLTQVGPLLTIGIGRIPGAGAQNAQAATTELCDEGSIDIFADFVQFNQCRLDFIIIDGSIAASGNSITFGFTVQELIFGSFLQAQGGLTLTTADDMGNPLDFPFIGGQINVSSSDFGDFGLSLQGVALALAPTGLPVFGTIVLTVDFPGITEIRCLLNGTDQVRAIVKFDNQITDQFLFDAVTGTLVVAPPATCLACAGPQGPFCGIGAQPFCDAECSCLHTTNGQCFCHQGTDCDIIGRMPCTSDDGCPSGFRCTQSCCGAVGESFCHPPCGTILSAGAASGETSQTSMSRPQ